MLSLIWGLPDCTTKTSFSLMLVRILTLVSPYSAVSSARYRLAENSRWQIETARHQLGPSLDSYISA